LTKAERIGYLREIVLQRIGRIYPVDEVKPRGFKVEAEARKCERLKH